jgi:UDP-N-acetyl-D-glucosamine dehydrogenase
MPLADQTLPATANPAGAGAGQTAVAAAMIDKLRRGTLRIGVIGLGYVGLPLAQVFWRAGLQVFGFDIDESKIEQIGRGQSYIKHFASGAVGEMIASGRLVATSDFARLAEVDVILICVPTPLGAARAPDLSFVVSTAETIARFMAKGTLVVLESTTYPGTTTEVVQPVLEQGGRRLGEDFLLAFSPEREDPGSGIETNVIPKIVGGADPASGDVSRAVYGAAFQSVFPVRDAATAEAVKITENVFRAVNIALVNELKLLYGRMGIDIWEVIEAAKTKPFGFMPFYPGPGLGGHCIPIDPFYLSWRARGFDMDARFVELAGEINRSMPGIVVETLQNEVNAKLGRAMRDARILVIGVSYKKNIDDLRESPALRIIELIQAKGSKVDYHDPFFDEIPPTREHGSLRGMRSVPLQPTIIASYDAAVIVTNHDKVDYQMLVDHSQLVIDTRNATRSIKGAEAKVVPA